MIAADALRRELELLSKDEIVDLVLRVRDQLEDLARAGVELRAGGFTALDLDALGSAIDRVERELRPGAE